MFYNEIGFIICNQEVNKQGLKIKFTVWNSALFKYLGAGYLESGIFWSRKKERGWDLEQEVFPWWQT